MADTRLFYFKAGDDETYSPGLYIYEITSPLRKVEFNSSDVSMQERKLQELLNSRSNIYDGIEINKYMNCNLNEALIIISKQRKSLQTLFVDDKLLADQIEKVLINHKVIFKRKTNPNESSFLFNQDKDKKYGYKHLRDLKQSLKKDKVMPTYIYENGKKVKVINNESVLLGSAPDTIQSINFDDHNFDDFSTGVFLTMFSKSLEKATTSKESVKENIKNMLIEHNIYFILIKKNNIYTFYFKPIDLIDLDADEKVTFTGDLLSKRD